MSGRVFALCCLSLMSVQTAPAAAQDAVAPCSLCAAAPTVIDQKPATPVSLAVEVNLDFDRLVLTGAGNGSAELGPDGIRNATGSVSAISAKAMVGEVVIRGEPGRYVRIELPRRIELQGFSGGAIRLESVRSDLPQMPKLDGNGMLRFRLGGVLQLTGDLSGAFRGDVPIEVNYL